MYVTPGEAGATGAAAIESAVEKDVSKLNQAKTCSALWLPLFVRIRFSPKRHVELNEDCHSSSKPERRKELGEYTKVPKLLNCQSGPHIL